MLVRPVRQPHTLRLQAAELKFDHQKCSNLFPLAALLQDFQIEDYKMLPPRARN